MILKMHRCNTSVYFWVAFDVLTETIDTVASFE